MHLMPWTTLFWYSNDSNACEIIENHKFSVNYFVLFYYEINPLMNMIINLKPHIASVK